MTAALLRSFRAAATRVAVTLGLAAMLLAGLAAEAGATRIQRVVSPGGIEAWLVEDHTVPLIALEFSFPGGSADDPAGKEGLANLLSTLLDEGAGDIESQAFQRRLEDLAIRLAFQDQRDRFSGEMKTLGEHRDEAFDLLGLALSRPRFDAEAVERMRVQSIAALRRSAKNPDAIAARRWAAAVFPGHPYGRPAEGTEASVAAIGVADLKDLHRRLFARAGLRVAVVGDIDAATLAPRLDRIFGALPAAGDLPPIAEATVASAGRIDEVVPVAQTAIRFGGPGLKRRDPDFIAAHVMNHILGGGSFSSWLYDSVREKRGLAYSISTGLAPFARAGLFVGALGTRPDKVDEAIALVEAEIARMRDVGPTAEELAAAKAFLIGSYPLRFDTSDKIAGQLLAIQVDGLGIDYVDRRNAEIERVSLDDVRRVARRLFAGRPTIVTVGPKPE